MKINFNPTNPKEVAHLLKLKSLLNQKRVGDWRLVADLLGISQQHAKVSFQRVYSKHHFEVVKSLEEVINNRHSLLMKNE